MKVCCKCKKEKDKSEFHRNNRRSDGLQTYCKECSLKRRREYYLKNREKEDARNKARQKLVQDFVKKYKEERGCSKCEERRWYVLQFHHVDKHEKEAEISSLVRYANLNRLKKEIAKCIVVCANCHIEIHYIQNDQWSGAVV